MGMSAKEIESLLMQSFPDAQIELVDLAGDNDHYNLTIASQAFEGQSRISRQRMVTNALKVGKGNELHALSITTKVPG